MADVNVGSITGYVSLNTSKAEQAAIKLNAVLAKISAQTNLLAAKTSATTQLAASKVAVQQAQISKIGAQTAKTVAQTNQITNKGFRDSINHTRNLYKGLGGVKTSFKDIGRVAAGILMARAINSVLRAIMGAIDALKEFNSLLETTQISFKYLMQISKSEVDSFISKLEDLAAITPYTFETVTTGAQRLLALGFNENQILPMLRVMADLNAATGGGADQMEALAYAFGKVQAMGKMTTRELRLFVTANIPIYKILREELGLTDKDFQKLRISASDAIPAILNGIKKFQGAAKEAEKTIPGLLSSIHDYLLFLGRDILGSVWESIRGFLTNLRDLLAKVREAFKEGGIKAALSALFPPWLAGTVINIYNSLVKLGQSLSHVWQVTAPVRKELAHLGITVANTVIKAISGLVKIVDFLATNSAKSAKFLKILAEAIIGLMVAVTVSKVILALVNSISMLFSGANIAIPILVTLGTVLTALALSIPSVQRWMSSLGQTIAGTLNIANRTQGLMGYINSVRKGITDTSELSFQDLINSFSDVGDEAEETGKKIKDTFLASFDEIYAIPDMAEAAGLEGFGGFGDIDLGNMREISDLAGKVADSTKKRLTHSEALIKLQESGIKAGLKVAERSLLDLASSAGFKFWTTVWTHPGIAFKQLWKDSEEIAKLIISKVEHMAATIVKNVTEWVEKAYWEVYAFIAKLYTNISEVVSQAIIKLIEVWNTVKQWAIDSWINIKNNAIGIWNEIKDWAINSWNNIKANALVIWTAIKLWALLAWESIKTRVIGIWDEIKTKAIGIWDYITAWAKTNWDVLLEKAKNIWTAIETWARGIWDNITLWAGSIWDTIYEKAKSVWDGILGYVKGIMAQIVNAFIEAWNQLPLVEDIAPITVPTTLTPPKGVTVPSWVGRGTPRAGHAASGAVVYKNQLVNVGEGSRPEMIAPLSESSLAPFANMIAGLIGRTNSSNQMSVASDYVLVPVNKRQLERELYVIRKQESLRIAGRTI
jgi:tape measure domain-containing protein